MRTIFHIDVNCAFLSWEAVHRLSNSEETDLREIPSVVAGDPDRRRGIILAKSEPAKRYGIATAQTLYSALRKCPGLTVVSPTPGIYKKYSKALMDMIFEYTDVVEQCSIDEAFADVTGLVNMHGVSPVELADQLRERVRSKLGFTVNIGVSCNKLLAKAASELKKPDRTHTMYPDEIRSKYWPLPVREMIGVGGSVEQKLKRLGIKTIGDIAGSSELYLNSMFKSYGSVLYRKANGIDESPVEAHDETKSIGNSTTTPRDIETFEQAHEYIAELSEMVGKRLRGKSLRAYCVGVEIRYSDFRRVQMQSTLRSPISSYNDIYSSAKKLFQRLWTKEPIRHLGIRAMRLESADIEQLSFLDEKKPDIEKLDRTIDGLRAKYGEGIIKRL